MNTPYVYAITDGEFIKIGVARTPTKRIKALSTGSAAKLTLLGMFEGGFEEENNIHKAFKKVRENGEWMHPTQDLLDYLNEKIHDKFITCESGELKWFRKMNNG